MTGETENKKAFTSQYVHTAEPMESGVKHLSFSTAVSGDVYLETDFLAGNDSERVFKNKILSISANGYPKFFDAGIYTKQLMQNKWYLVDIILNTETKKAQLYIDGERLANVNLPDFPSNEIKRVLFVKKGWKTAYVTDISFTAEDCDPSVSVMSDSPYYANTISDKSGTIDVYNNENGARFVSKLRISGASDAVLLNENGTETSDMSENKYLRVTTDEGKKLYYIMKNGNNKYLSSLDDINVSDSVNRDTEGFYVYKQPQMEKIKGSALDVSFLLDAPAGKNGFTERLGDKFILSGTRKEIKFWGTNLSDKDLFLEHADAEKMADRIAQMGFNIVRIHKFDTSYLENVIRINPLTNKPELDEEQMDKLCYFLAALKESGIYRDINLYFDQKIYDRDDVDYHDTAEMFPAGYWNQSLIDVQNGFAKDILGYTNPYTGLRIADDPALALVDMVNERTIYAEELEKLGRYYDELNTKFTAWLKNRYTDRDALKSAWEYTPNWWFGTGLQEDEDPWADGKPVKVMDVNKEGTKICRGRATAGRCADTNKFLCEVESSYYTQRREYLKNTVGVKCPITGGTVFSSNQIETNYALTKTDFISNHVYWSGCSGYVTESGKTFNGYSQLDSSSFGIIGYTSKTRIYGIPYTLDEWNHGNPSAYTAEGPFLASAYSRLNNLNAFSFNFNASEYIEGINNDDYTFVSPYNLLKYPIGVVKNPVAEAVYPTASVMFQRGDVAECETGYYESIKETDIGKAPDFDKSWVTINMLPNRNNALRGLIGKTGNVYDISGLNSGLSNDERIKNAADEAANGDKKFTSLTGELTTDLNNRIFTADTAGTQAVCGFIGGNTISLENINVKVNNSYAAVSITSIDRNYADIRSAKRLLLTMAGENKNYGQIVEEDAEKGKQLSTIKIGGRAPVLTEQITGEITLKLDGDYTVYPLTSSGEKKSPIELTKVNDGFKFNVTRDMETMYFEIIKN